MGNRLEAKHGMPVDEISGHVYVLHYDEPQIVKSVSGDYAGPSPRSDADGWLSATAIRHYVGWTQQRLPRKRINRHGPAALREIVYLQPGTMRDEETMKASGSCPKCGEALAASLAHVPNSGPSIRRYRAVRRRRITAGDRMFSDRVVDTRPGLRARIWAGHLT